jgi:hypothetical protein
VVLRRLFTSLSAFAAVAGGLVLVSPTAAAADDFVPSTTIVRGSWAYLDKAVPTGGFANQPGDAPVGAWAVGDGDGDDQGEQHVARSYFTFDVAPLAGKHILAATLAARETQANDCQRRSIELWETGPFTPASSWRNPPAMQQLLAAQGAPQQGCLVEDARFDVTGALTRAAGANRPAITLALRVDREHESVVAYGRRFANDLTLSITYNTPPATPTGLAIPRQYTNGDGDLGCALSAPGDYYNPERTSTAFVPLFRAAVADADPGDVLHARFAVWSVADPSQRWEDLWSVYGTTASAQLNQPRLTEGQTYAWQVRAEDGTDVSAWSQTCYFTIDFTPPGPPEVTSEVYPDDGLEGHGAPGVPGTFTFTPNGSADVVRYRYRFYPDQDEWQSVPADGPGGSATVTFTPLRPGPYSVSVLAVDRASTSSPYEAYHPFWVRNNLPGVWSDMYPEYTTNPAAGVGVPGVFQFSPGMSDVVEYAYRLDDGPTQTVAAGADGRASVTLTPTSGGQHVLRVSNRNRDGVTSLEREYRFLVDTAPTVTGDVNRYVYIGSTSSYRFAPRMIDVVEYEYWFVDEQQRETPHVTVPAGADGTAGGTRTATASGWFWLKVRSRSADGTLSEIRTMFVPVDGARPQITRTGGELPGEPAVITFDSPMENVTEYVYTLNLDPSTTTTVPAGPDGTATITWTPTELGWAQINVRARNAAGLLSDEDSTWFYVDGAPEVSSTDFPRFGAVPRRPGSFTFTPRAQNVVGYEYRFNFGTPATVPAGADGSATVTWTPTGDGYHQLDVRSRSADGTLSPYRTYSFEVNSAPFVWSDEYPMWTESGAPGVPGTFRLSPQAAGVTEYVYTFDYEFNGPGPEASVAAGPDGAASFTWAPPDPGIYLLSVRARDADGVLSAVTEYYFYVGLPPEALPPA